MRKTTASGSVVEVTYHPVRKNLHLGQKNRLFLRSRAGESPQLAAERALARRFKVRDYLIVEARPFIDGL